nr:MAG TPA: tail protein [Caudoviricetes sp.]
MSSKRCYPLSGTIRVTSPFGRRDPIQTPNGMSSSDHLGIDMVSEGPNASKLILSASNGTVTKVGHGYNEGNYIWVSNEDNTGCMYCHLKDTYVTVGTKVTCKQVIGYMGRTGTASGVHLDFKTSMSGSYSTSWGKTHAYFIDPAIWLGMPVNGKNTYDKTFDGGKAPIDVDSYIPADNQQSIYGSTTTTITSSSSTSTTEISPSGEYYEIADLKGVTKDWLYGRRYRIIVDLGNGEAFDVSNLRCEFSIVKSLYLKMQTSKITIWNLSPENENKLISSGQRIIVEAGYNGEFYGKIFEGNIIQPLRYKDNGVDYKLTLIAMDSDRFVSSAIIGVSEVAKQSRRNVVNDIASKASIPSQLGNVLQTDFVYPRGKVMFGKASDYLEQIAKSEKARYYNDDGKVNIIDAGTIEEGYIFDLGSKTGLISSPVQNEYGVNCECLLNPMIRLNSLFHLDNSRVKGKEYEYGTPIRSLDVEGIYRVIEITYVGDTRGDDWKCSINAITQAGMLPDMALNGQTLIW